MTDQVSVDMPGQSRRKSKIRKILSGILWCLDHWVLVVSLFLSIYITLPFLAPLFMRLGWSIPASVIYAIYSTQCHQMAQRSFFLFGPQPMYNIAQLPITLTGRSVSDMLLLHEFVGNANMGWKVAWSDRMVYMYGGLWLAGIAFGWLRHRRQVHSLNIFWFGLLLLPMVVDGFTHLLSDTVGGLAEGFRYGNQWLANLTGNALPQWFYVGDALGSFNSWMRLLSGITFAIGVVWLAYPYMNDALVESATKLRLKLTRAASTTSSGDY